MAEAKKKVSREKVEAALNEIRKVLIRDGGDLELVDITDDNQVKVRLQGHCVGCPGAQMTLSMVVQEILAEAVPEVTGVVNVTD